MPESVAERALQALYAALSSALPVGAVLERNSALPLRIPPGGLMILRDGDPGDPQVILSPLRYDYDHMAELDIHAGNPDQAARDATFDTLKRSVALALQVDRSLGGLADDLRARAPRALLIKPIDGATEIKAATIPIIITYVTDDPLT